MARIVVLASYAPSLVLFRAPLLRMLVERGHEVVACAPHDELVDSEMKRLGVRMVALGPRRASVNPVADSYYCWRLLRFLRSLRPDAVLAYTAKPVIWGAIASRCANVQRRYAMITGLGYAFTGAGKRRSVIGKIVSRLYRIALDQCHKVVFQNSDDMWEFIDRGLIRDPSKAFVVNGSGVELDRFAPVPLPDRLTFLLIARLLRDKGIEEYVAAARAVKRTHPEVVFRLVGWFDENPSAVTREQVRDWVGEGTIEYRGHVSDVRPEISEATVYVLPSYREGMPRTVLEAMAMARPIITTDTPGCRDTVIQGANGFLVPIRDSVALAEAMMCFVDAPGLAVAMGKRSREIAESRYDARAVATAVIDGMGL
jgi:glycosyltransferase involved in cell wall biosynthesis